MIRRLTQNVERFLWARGFVLAPVREILTVQILLSGLFLTLGLVCLPFSIWPLCFCLGATLMTGAFWSLAKSAQSLPGRSFSVKLALTLFAGFSMRLLVAGTILFCVVVLLRAPAIPLLAGLSVTMLTITVWSLARMTQGRRE